MAITNVDVLNLALAKIGAKSVTLVTDIKSSLISGETLVEQKRNEVFQKPIPWHFATVRAELTEHTATPPNGSYDHYYVLPTGCMRILSTIDQYDDDVHYPYRRELSAVTSGTPAVTVLTPVIDCNEDEVFIKYIHKITDPALWPSWFINLVACEIALELVEPYKQDGGGLYQKIAALLERAENAAKAANAAENLDTNNQNRNTDFGNEDVTKAAYYGVN